MTTAIDKIAKLIEKKASRLPAKATVVRIDGDLADITLGLGSGTIHHVQAYGGTDNLSPGMQVPIQWIERTGGYLFPVITIGGGGGGGGVVSGSVIGDNQTIQVIDGVVAVKSAGIQLSHLGFEPSLDGHTHTEYSPTSHTHAGILAQWIESENALRDRWGNIVLDGASGRVATHELEVLNMAPPGNPAAGRVRIFANQKGMLSTVDSNGQVSTWRERLTAPRIYYVKRAEDGGSDSADGRTLATAFATIQTAVNVVAGLDINACNVTIEVAGGTYGAGVSLPNVIGYALPGNLVIKGSGSSTIISTAGTCVAASAISTTWDIKNMTLTSSSSHCLSADTGASLRFSGINFGYSGGNHVHAADGGAIACIGPYSISGSPAYHIYCQAGTVGIGGVEVKFENNIQLRSAYARAFMLGSIIVLSTYNYGVYRATGRKSEASMNGAIFRGGVLPGDILGTTDTGGQCP